MDIVQAMERLAAFADGGRGGNPAGVLVVDRLPEPAAMQAAARAVGYSECVFAAPEGQGWRARYFAPEAEVPFCGHATIALGAALGARFGPGLFDLQTLAGPVSVRATPGPGGWQAELTSPPTRSGDLPDDLSAALMGLFGLVPGDLDPALPPALAHGGADHAVFLLRDRGRLAQMAYPFDALRDLMQARGLTTISLLWAETPALFHARNAFAIGGVVEDPATGAAAAALGGLLVDRGWPGLGQGGHFTLLQGEDMGQPSRLDVRVTGQSGAPVRVAGGVRPL